MPYETEYLTEPFLQQYFLFETLIRDIDESYDCRPLFDELARLFCLPASVETEALYQASRMPTFRAMHDLRSYERFCRLLAFGAESGQDPALTATDRVLLSGKREALRVKSELFAKGGHRTDEQLALTLESFAMKGSVEAMTTLAFFEYHGLFFCRDEKTARKRIRLAASWNSLFGNLMGIAYDSEHTDDYYDTLAVTLSGVGRRRVFTYLCEAGQVCPERTRRHSAKLIEKAFGLSVIDRRVYDAVFAKVAFSGLLSPEDKEKLLLCRKQDILAPLSDIPFEAKGDTPLTFDREAIGTPPLSRTEERDRILRSITVAVRCPAAVRLPLLITCRDAFVTDLYRRMLSDGFADTPVIELDAATLTEQDFLPGKENVFLRGLSDTKRTRTVFFLRHAEALSERPLEEMQKMLDFHYRKRFKLFQPPVSLDLSEMFFVLFASERCEATEVLAPLCDTVYAEPIADTERGAVIDAIFDERCHAFGQKAVALDSDARRYLIDCGCEQARHLLDDALRRAVYEDRTAISLSLVTAIAAERKQHGTPTAFGFVGGNNRYA